MEYERIDGVLWEMYVDSETDEYVAEHPVIGLTAVGSTQAEARQNARHMARVYRVLTSDE